MSSLRQGRRLARRLPLLAMGLSKQESSQRQRLALRRIDEFTALVEQAREQLRGSEFTRVKKVRKPGPLYLVLAASRSSSETPSQS